MNRQNDVSLPEGTKARGVYLALRDQIMSGRLSDGETLPTEQRLAESHGVSRVTVRKALNVLADAGLIKRRAGSGTTVCAPADHQRTAMNFNTLMPQLVEMGNKTTARLLSFAYETSPDYVTRAMGWDTPQMVQVATRVRQVDEGIVQTDSEVDNSDQECSCCTVSREGELSYSFHLHSVIAIV